MKTKTLLLIFILTFSSLQAQKSAPVAGDAATLLDLLYKDYNSVNPDSQIEELAKDRSKVVSIFKSYHKDTPDFSSIISTVNTSRYNYLNSLEEYNTFLKKSEITSNDIKLLRSVKSSLNTNKNNYYNDLNAVDNLQLEKLKSDFDSQNPKNLFLIEIIKKFQKKYTNIATNKADPFAINNSNLSIQKGLPFTGGDILVKGIDGLSRVIADNIKKEIILNIMENLQEYLKNKEKNQYLYELEVLLPSTVDYLKNFDSDQLVKFSSDLQQYIEGDLKKLVPNAVNLRNTPRVASAIQKYPDLDFAMEGLEVLDKITKIKSPVDYFELIENSRNINRWSSSGDETKKGIAKGLHLASMLAYSLTIVENGELKFVTTNFISNYGSQADFGYMFFGLLHQQNIKYYDLKFNDKYFTVFVSDISKLSSVQKFITSDVIPIVENAERIHNQFTAIKKKNKNNEKVAFEEMHQLINDVLNFGEEITTSSQKLLTMSLSATDLGESTTNIEKIKPYFTIAKMSNAISLDLHEKRYTNAITKAIEIPITLFNLQGNAPIWLQNSKIAIETFNNLNPLIEILSISQIQSTEEKLSLWKRQKNNIEIIALKFDEVNDLKNIAATLKTATINIPTDSWNQAKFDAEYAAIVGAIKLKREAVYLFLGTDLSKVKTDLTAKMDEKKLQQSTKDFILGKLTSYQQKLFDKFLLGEKNIIVDENELLEVYEAFLPELLSKESIKSNTKLVKVIHFVNDVAQADTPEKYKKAIEAFVLPVGSSSLKEKSSYYFSLNSFPGLLGGVEKSEGISSASFIGFTAPVGLYFQMSANKNRSTWGLFMPIIDIAAPVRLRLDNSNDTKSLPDFEFDDIFSPGLYIVYGLPKSPLAFNLGVQYGPKLRNIPTDDTTTFTSVESYRIGLGITLDIPLLTLSSKYKNE